MNRKISEVLPNFIIINGEPEFSYGILFPHNIVYDGEEISLPFAKEIIKNILKEELYLSDLYIISRFGKDNNNAILGYDCKNFFKDAYDENEIQLKENIIYKGTIIAKTLSETIVSLNGQYGYIKGIIEADINENISVSIIDKAKNKFGFCRFAIADEYEDFEDIEEVSESIEKFLSKEELAAIEEEQREKIDWVLEKIDGITRKNINVIREKLHLSYNPDIQSDLARFIKESPHYFSENNFWVGAYRTKDNGDVKIIIYDSNDVVLEVLVNATGMWVQEFSHDKNKSNAQYLIKNNQKALVISGNNILLHEGTYLREGYVETGEKILNQLEVAKNILPKIKKHIKDIKEKLGFEYLLLKDFLKFQEDKEKEYNKTHVVKIAPNQARITTAIRSRMPSTALFIDKSCEAHTLYTENDSEVCYIEVSNNEVVTKAELVEDSLNNGYIIEFYGHHFDIDGFRKSGFEIRRRASVRHLILQKESINDFVYGNGTFNIFDKLNKGELVSPEPDTSFTFFDDKFNNVEEGNNQPIAIRKAVNTNDIFIIQGPPGTGKTSVIVEIIKQLVINRHEKVLVCSQAHSAVRNIYIRLKDTDNRIKIGNIDESDTMEPDDLKEHPDFIKNNEFLLKRLSEKKDEAEKVKYEDFTYQSTSKTKYLKYHKYVCDYFEETKYDNIIELIDILSEFKQELTELGDEAQAFNDATHYQGLNVIMGTCIGIGMDRNLQKSGLYFDTVIIDEAGKANLSETTVPMQLGRKYILVGDNKQLPPYIDSEEITTFSNKYNNIEKSEVEEALGSSLFEDFLEDEQYPKESAILLNYQYRMNPEIGEYISELFYNNELRSGKGTEKQVCRLESFTSAVTFIDTTIYGEGEDNPAYEKGSLNEGWYNPKEIEIFKERILPRLEDAKRENPELTVGIITPYRLQRSKLLEEVKNTSLENTVYTIDSIQGSEFDIVILSLVRAFNTNKKNRTVGFLDDMRRLNVALSRAKKNLIIIGNMKTLSSTNAHINRESNTGIKPVEVFKKLQEIQERTVERTSLHSFKEKIKEGKVKEGQMFPGCLWKIYEGNTKLAVGIEIDGVIHYFPIKYDDKFKRYGVNRKTIDIKFLNIGEDGRAKFEFIPNVSIADMVNDGFMRNVKGIAIDWVENEEDKMLFRFDDDSESELYIYRNESDNSILWPLLNSLEEISIPLYINEKKEATLDISEYKAFQEKYNEGDSIEVEIIDDEDTKFYIVKAGNIYGKVMKYRRNYKMNSVHKATIHRIYRNSVTFNVIL